MSEPSNIRDRLKLFFAEKNSSIFSGMDSESIVFFQSLVSEFLGCDTYPEAEEAAYNLKNYIFNLHGKLEAFRKALYDLDQVENDLNESYQRLHFVHQAHVFLLGLYLYGNFPGIKQAIDAEMRDTSGDFLSGGDEVGEFLFRWRMASVVHDLGYALSLFADNDQLNSRINGFSRVLSRPISRPEEIYRFEEKNLLFQLSDRVKERFGFSLRPIVYSLNRVHPFQNRGKTPPFYDHGILSALIFLYLINYEYSLPHYDSLHIAGYELVWDPKFLDNCFPEIAMAIALHNLDWNGYETIFKLNTKRYYSAQLSPFAWLLKVCDMLQEWDKPATNDHDKKHGNLESLVIDFRLSENGGLDVVNFPPKPDVKKIIEGFTKTPIQIRIFFQDPV